MQTYQKDKSSILYLISHYGGKVDISSFLTDESDCVLKDFDNNFKELNILNSCGIIKFKNNKIDSVIEINISNLDSSILYLNQIILK